MKGVPPKRVEMFRQVFLQLDANVPSRRIHAT